MRQIGVGRTAGPQAGLRSKIGNCVTTLLEIVERRELALNFFSQQPMINTSRETFITFLEAL